MKYIFFLVLTTLALFSCNTKEKAQKQRLFCYVRYDEAVKAVTAEASLQDATNKTSVEFPGGIRYQGIEMSLTPVYGMTYRYEYAADFLPEHTFEWRGPKNDKNKFRMGLDPIKAFALSADKISQSDPTVLKWEGAPLGKGETVVFMWENTAKGLTVPMEVSTSSGQPFIEIPAAKLQEVEPGDWTLYLVRKKLTIDTIAGLPVSGIMEYYSKTIPVTMTK